MRDSRRVRLVLALLILVAFTLITLDYRSSQNSVFAGIRSGASAVFGPIEHGFTAAFRPVGDFFSGLGSVGSNQDKIRQLQQENDALRSRLRTSGQADRELATLRDTLGLAAKGQFKVVPAEVVALGGASGFEWTATIDAGSRDGVRPDQTVISGKGLVGRVKYVGPTSATIVLAIDPGSTVGVQMVKSGEVGRIDGQGLDRPLQLTLLSSTAHLAKGAQVVTWGSEQDRPYVPAVPVGTVTSIQKTPGAPTRTASVQPYVDFTALHEVAVVVGAPPHVPRNALVPTPTPTPSPPPPAAKASPTSTPGHQASPASGH